MSSMLSDQDEAYTPDLKPASFAPQVPSDYVNSPRRDEMRLAYQGHEVVGTFSLGSGRPGQAGDAEVNGQSPWRRTCDVERRSSNGLLALTDLFSLVQVLLLKGCIQNVP